MYCVFQERPRKCVHHKWSMYNRINVTTDLFLEHSLTYRAPPYISYPKLFFCILHADTLTNAPRVGVKVMLCMILSAMDQEEVPERCSVKQRTIDRILAHEMYGGKHLE